MYYLSSLPFCYRLYVIPFDAFTYTKDLVRLDFFTSKIKTYKYQLHTTLHQSLLRARWRCQPVKFGLDILFCVSIFRQNGNNYYVDAPLYYVLIVANRPSAKKHSELFNMGQFQTLLYGRMVFGLIETSSIKITFTSSIFTTCVHRFHPQIVRLFVSIKFLGLCSIVDLLVFCYVYVIDSHSLCLQF